MRELRRLTAVGAMAAAGVLATTLCPGVAGAAVSVRPPPLPPIPCGDTAALKARIVALNQFTETTPPIVLSKNCVYTVTAPDNVQEATGPDGITDITGNITIDGNGSTIVRSSAARFRLFRVADGGKLTLKDIAVTNGDANGGPGGAILDLGELHLDNTTVTGNTSTLGGGVFIGHGATARITGGTLAANHSTDVGGAITNAGTLVVTDTTITANASTNQGGAIANSGGNLTLDNVTISHNTAGNGSGGLASFGGGTVTITGGQIVENTTQRPVPGESTKPPAP
jgi:hypothetical protein